MKKKVSASVQTFAEKVKNAQEDLIKMEQEIAPFVKKRMVVEQTTAGSWRDTARLLTDESSAQ